MLFCMFPAAASALHSDLELYVDGEKQELLHPLLYKEQHIYISIGAAAKQFALEGKSRIADQEAELTISGTTFRFQADGPTAVHGHSETKMNAPALVMEDVFYIPLNFVADKLNMRLSWDSWTQSASLYKISTPVSNPESLSPSKPVIEEQMETKVLGAEKPASEWGQAVQLTRIGVEGGKLAVQTSGAVQVQPFYLSDPSKTMPDRLVLDVTHAVLDTRLNEEASEEGNSMLVNHPLIRQVRFAQFSQDPLIVRVVLDLKQPVSYQVEERSDGGFSVSLQTAETAEDVSGMTYQVVIDAGHGGKDPGATGLSKKEEKEFNLKVAKKVQAVLAEFPQVNVRMTRDDDTYITLDGRVNMANHWPADVFVSIHANTFERPIGGTETYYWNDNSKAFADLIHQRLVDASGFEDRGVRKTSFKVIRETTMPAVLLEIGYLTNAEQERELLDDAFQDKIALTIAHSILEYLNLSYPNHQF